MVVRFVRQFVDSASDCLHKMQIDAATTTAKNATLVQSCKQSYRLIEKVNDDTSVAGCDGRSCVEWEELEDFRHQPGLMIGANALSPLLVRAGWSEL